MNISSTCNPEVKPNENVVIGITTFAENGLPVLAGKLRPLVCEFRNSESCEIVSTNCGRGPGGVAPGWGSGSPDRRRRLSPRLRPGEGEAEAGGEEAAMAAKRIGGSGARGWGGS